MEQQIPPLRCGMTKKREVQKAEADSSAVLRNDNKRDKKT
jgi:hypothetical protein